MAEGAERAASVKLSLDSGEYLVELRKVGDENRRVANEGKQRFDAMGKGIDAAKGSLKGLFSSAKSGIGTLATLGGAFTAANAIKGAVALDARFRQLAFRASVATKQLVTTTSVQDDVQRSAAMTSRTSDEMAGAFDRVFSATKDLQFSRDVLNAIGTTATATGESVDTVATIAQQMQRKFKLSANEVDDALAQVYEGAQQGGPAFADFAAAIDVVGADLLQAGLSGKRGLGFLIGALNAADAESGGLEKQIAGLQGLFSKLGNPKQIEGLAKALYMDPKKVLNEKDALGRLGAFLRQGQKGLDALKATFVGPEEAKALRILFTDPFEQALERAKASGLKGKDAVDQALTVLQTQIGKFGEASITAADLQKRAAEEAVKPEANLRKALERLERSFSQPELIDAIDEITKVAPALAKWFAKLASFAAKSPLLAGTLAIGSRAGGSFLAGSAAELLKAHLAGGKEAGKALGEGVQAGAKAGSGLLAGAGVAFGVAAAGLIAAEWIKNKADEDAKTTSDLAASMAGASSSMGSKERQQALADQLQRSIAAAEESRSGVGGFAEDVFSGVGGLLTGTVPAATEKDAQIREAKELLARKRAAIAAMVERPAVAADSAGSAAPASRGRVALDPGAPRLIGSAVSDALGGKTLSVRIVSGGGVGAQPRSFGGGRGPINMPAAQPGGGV